MAKQPSPAQLRARREFARRAKAGTLRKGSKLTVTRRASSTSTTSSRTRSRRSSSTRGRRRTTVTKKNKGGGGRAKTMGIATTLADLNAAGQMIEPMLPAIAQAASGNFQGAVAAAKAGAKEAISGANLTQAIGPSLGVRVIKKVAGWFGVQNPRLGRSRFRLL